MAKNQLLVKKILLTILSALVFLLIPTGVRSESISGDSAKVVFAYSNYLNTLNQSKKKMAIAKVLDRYDSPLSDSLDAFLATCLLYKLDCYLLPSIAGLESTFGNFVLPNSNNPFGWGGGYIVFNSWESAIAVVGRGLRENYINKGADTLDKIASIYAESKTWAPRVQNFMSAFALEEARIDSILVGNQVKL